MKKMEIWNSIEQLTKINNLLQIGLVIFGILAGMIGAASFIVANRKEHLQKVEESNFQKKVSVIDKRTNAINDLLNRSLTEKQKAINGDGRTIEKNDLQNRRLTEKQKAILKKALQNTSAVNVLAIRGNSKESQQYSKQIEDILIEAGWNVKHFLPLGSLREISSPTIAINVNKKGLKEFETLKKTITEASLQFHFDEFESENIEQEIILDVGIIPLNEYQTLIDKIN